MKKIRTVLYVSGNVFGVGFRESVKHEAQENHSGITGYAKNLSLSDGRVEIVLEGDWIRVLKLSEWIRQRPGVSRVEYRAGRYTGEFDDFYTK